MFLSNKSPKLSAAALLALTSPADQQKGIRFKNNFNFLETIESNVVNELTDD
jgi:hypothetical protein